MMGHVALSTTAGYMHVSNELIASIKSPLDFLAMDMDQASKQDRKHSMSIDDCETSSPTSKPAIEVADIFRKHGKGFLNNYSASPEQVRVINQIITCRTAAQGGMLNFVIVAVIPEMPITHAETVTVPNARPWQRRIG